MSYQILNEIKSPRDIKNLEYVQIDRLCEEARGCILETVSKNGGHLASNLGSVELTVALHRAFNSPEDAIIFDVGHQCYTHKLLTGRYKDFSTLRQEGGISGFMRPNESEHDPFITGHSSNSVSAAYGIYKSKKLKGEGGTAVAVIGDGALTGGMAYEALNNAGNEKGNFIVVLNDNEMSISKNVGSLARSLTKMRNKPKYHHFKYAISHILLKIPLVGKYLNNGIFALKEGVKRLIYKNNLFSSLGFNYLGPVDGHNVMAMEALFNVAKEYNRPSLIHVVTIKGKGYPYAETEPKDYHGVSPFDVESGISGSTGESFSYIAGKTLCNLSAKNSKICAITAAMTEGTGLLEFSQKYENRFFDVGIAEAHAVTFGAGLAKEGLIPFFAVYSSFLQRGYDQLVHDVGISRLPLKLLIDRAGIVGEDGETHQGLFDISFLTSIPNAEIYSPCTYEELEYRIDYVAENNRFSAIRYPRGREKDCLSFDIKADFSHIKGEGNTAIVTYGRLYSEASNAKAAENSIDIIKLNKIYPFTEELLNTLKGFKKILFFEESIKNGGIGEHLLLEMTNRGFKGEFKINAVENEYVAAATVTSALKNQKLDCQAMLDAVKES